MEIEEKQQEGQPEPEERAGPPERPQVVVDLSEEDDEPEDKQEAEPETKKGRRQQARDFRRQKQEYERKIADYDRQLAELRGMVSARPAAPATPAQTADPAQAEIDSLSDQYEALLTAIQVAPNQETANKLVKQARSIESKRRALEIKQIMATEQRGRGGGEDADPDKYAKAIIEAEFPQIISNPALQHRAKAHLFEILQQGNLRGLAAAREAGRRTLADAGIGRKPPAPTDADKARLSGVPGRAGASGPASNNLYAPPKFELNLARAWVKGRPGATGMSDEEAWRIWSRETGNRRQTG